MEKEAALAALLVELFETQDNLGRFVYSIPIQDPGVSRAIRAGSALGASSTERMALWFVDELRRRGLVDERFFAHLIEERPESTDRIRAVQQRWLVESDEWTRVPASEPSIQRQGDVRPRTEGPTVLVSYARNDAAFFEELSAHLALLQRKGVIQVWHEGRIRAGEVWANVIASQLQSADIFVLLVSADLLASSFFWDVELKRMLERQEQGKAEVIPVIVRPCLWEDSPLARFQALPTDGKPVALSPDPDRTWVSIARRVEQVAREMRSAK